MRFSLSLVLFNKSGAPKRKYARSINRSIVAYHNFLEVESPFRPGAVMPTKLLVKVAKVAKMSNLRAL